VQITVWEGTTYSGIAKELIAPLLDKLVAKFMEVNFPSAGEEGQNTKLK
jgi:hypothetical protein